MTGAGPPVVRSSTGRVHHAGCRTLGRLPGPVTPTPAAWQALRGWWTARYDPDGRWTPPPPPWSTCCAHRIARHAGWPDAAARRPAGEPPPSAVDLYLGVVVVDLCARAAAAWAVGLVDAAERFFAAAAAIPGEFLDPATADQEDRP